MVELFLKARTTQLFPFIILGHLAWAGMVLWQPDAMYREENQGGILTKQLWWLDFECHTGGGTRISTKPSFKAILSFF